MQKTTIRALLLGAMENFLILFGYALIYNFFPRKLVVIRAWIENTIGSFWFFLVLMFIFPGVNIIRKKKYLCVGNCVGVVLYFFVLSVCFAIFGD